MRDDWVGWCDEWFRRSGLYEIVKRRILLCGCRAMEERPTHQALQIVDGSFLLFELRPAIWDLLIAAVSPGYLPDARYGTRCSCRPELRLPKECSRSTP